jgi:hypothetical protein
MSRSIFDTFIHHDPRRLQAEPLSNAVVRKLETVKLESYQFHDGAVGALKGNVTAWVPVRRVGWARDRRSGNPIAVVLLRHRF